MDLIRAIRKKMNDETDRVLIFKFVSDNKLGVCAVVIQRDLSLQVEPIHSLTIDSEIPFEQARWLQHV